MRINVAKAQCPVSVTAFNKDMRHVMIASSLSDTTTMWSAMKRGILTSAKKLFGIVKRKSADWYEKNAPYLVPIFEEKRRAFLEHKKHPSSLNLEYLRAKRRRVQRESRACANEYWND